MRRSVANRADLPKDPEILSLMTFGKSEGAGTARCAALEEGKTRHTIYKQR